MTAFGPRLAAAVAARGPLCLGVDPHPELLAAWGLPADAGGLQAFCDVCVDAYAGFAVVKPQVAFFESYDPPLLILDPHHIQALGAPKPTPD